MGAFGNLQTSFRLTLASLRLIFRKPAVLALPLLTLLWTGTWVVGPLSLFIWLEETHPAASHAFWKGVFFVSARAFESGDFGLMVASAIVTVYVLWSIWMTIALTGALYFVTVGMDVATQQIRTRQASLGPAFRVASSNLGRIFLVALTIATVVAWVKYTTTFVLRLVPFVGRWVNRIVRAALAAVTYLMLPIVVYERAGPVQAARSAWTNVRKTWSGLLVGTGLIYFAAWLLLNVFSGALFQGVLGLDGWANLIPAIVLAGVVYAVASSTAAALRATLYWYATTGEVPEGFRADDLPRLASHQPFTTLAAVGAAAVPAASHATPPTRPAAPTRAAPTPAPAAPTGGTPRRLACPKCKAVAVVPPGARPVCASCGYGKGSA